MQVSLNTDLVTIILFLVIALGIGLWYGKGVTSLHDYALGGRRFETATIAVTLVATYISGSTFSLIILNTYAVGILSIVTLIGQVISLFLCSYVLAPRMKEFLGKLSIAEVMGDLYGNHVKIITAICSVIKSTTVVALQIKVFSTMFSYFFAMHSVHAALISTVIVIIYAAFGGIRAIIFTDIYQFLAFGAFIPTFALLIWLGFGDFKALTTTLTTHPMFDPKLLLDYHNPIVLTYYGVFFYCLLPCLSPAMFQRALIAKSTKQISIAFKNCALTYLLFCFFVAWIGIMLVSMDHDMGLDNLVMYVIDSYSFSGLKGMIMVGVLAMTMSTADSHINTASIILVNDLCKPLRLLRDDQSTELGLVKIFSILIGTIALIIVLLQQDLLEILLLGADFYYPTVGIPLLVTILGFRSSIRVILSGIISGILIVIIWDCYFEPFFPISSVVPATIVNFIVMMVVHYLLKEPGGWVGPKKGPLNVIKVKDYQRRVAEFLK